VGHVQPIDQFVELEIFVSATLHHVEKVIFAVSLVENAFLISKPSQKGFRAFLSRFSHFIQIKI
jgi:hypothetical protein